MSRNPAEAVEGMAWFIWRAWFGWVKRPGRMKRRRRVCQKSEVRHRLQHDRGFASTYPRLPPVGKSETRVPGSSSLVADIIPPSPKGTSA